MHFIKSVLLLATAVTLATAAPARVQAANNACYYKRDIDSYVRRDADGQLVACKAQKREPVIAAADNACYYRRHEDGTMIGYKRDANGQESRCTQARDVAAREALRSDDNACYYKRNDSGDYVGYKRDAAGALVRC